MVISPWGDTHPAFLTSVMNRMWHFISRDFEVSSLNVFRYRLYLYQNAGFESSWWACGLLAIQICISSWGGTHHLFSTSVMSRMYDFISRDFEASSHNVTWRRLYLYQNAGFESSCWACGLLLIKIWLLRLGATHILRSRPAWWLECRILFQGILKHYAKMWPNADFICIRTQALRALAGHVFCC